MLYTKGCRRDVHVAAANLLGSGYESEDEKDGDEVKMFKIKNVKMPTDTPSDLTDVRRHCRVQKDKSDM